MVLLSAHQTLLQDLPRTRPFAPTIVLAFTVAFVTAVAVTVAFTALGHTSNNMAQKREESMRTRTDKTNKRQGSYSQEEMCITERDVWLRRCDELMCVKNALLNE